MEDKNVLCVITGIAIGIGVSYLYFKNEFNKQLDIQVEELKNHYKQKVREASEESKENSEKSFVIFEEMAELRRQEHNRNIYTPGVVDEKIDPLLEEDTSHIFEIEPTDVDCTGDEEYQFESYIMDAHGFISYEETGENVPKDVASEKMSRDLIYDFRDSEEEVIYIRNTKTKTDYEIYKSYKDEPEDVYDEIY